MNPSPSTSSTEEFPKPITSARRTLPEAPPSYYDFPPSYTANSETQTDELPAYVPREIPARQFAAPQPSQQRVYTVLPRQAYAIRMQRRVRRQPPASNYRRRLPLAISIMFMFLLIIAVLAITGVVTITA